MHPLAMLRSVLVCCVSSATNGSRHILSGEPTSSGVHKGTLPKSESSHTFPVIWITSSWHGKAVSGSGTKVHFLYRFDAPRPEAAWRLRLSDVSVYVITTHAFFYRGRTVTYVAFIFVLFRSHPEVRLSRGGVLLENTANRGVRTKRLCTWTAYPSGLVESQNGWDVAYTEFDSFVVRSVGVRLRGSTYDCHGTEVEGRKGTGEWLWDEVWFQRDSPQCVVSVWKYGRGGGANGRKPCAFRGATISF